MGWIIRINLNWLVVTAGTASDNLKCWIFEVKCEVWEEVGHWHIYNRTAENISAIWTCWTWIVPSSKKHQGGTHS